MKQMTKAISLLCILASMFSMFALPALAATDDNDANIGVTFVEPSLDIDSPIVTYGTSKPSDVWDFSSKGTYYISGTTYGETLYTNYKFKGKESYTVTITNSSDNDMTVTAQYWLGKITSMTVPANSKKTMTVNQKSSTKFYLKFEGSYITFSGSVS